MRSSHENLKLRLVTTSTQRTLGSRRVQRRLKTQPLVAHSMTRGEHMNQSYQQTADEHPQGKHPFVRMLCPTASAQQRGHRTFKRNFKKHELK